MGLCGCDGEGDSRYETRREHKERILSLNIVYFTQFMVVLSYSTILTGLWPFLNKLDPNAGKSFLGYLIGFSALGQTIFSPVIGYLSNKLKSSRWLFIISLVICIISYLIHAVVESFDRHRKYWLLLSRFLAGVGAANVSICRSHVATTTLIKERRKAVSILTSCSTVALAFGAVVQFVTLPLGDVGFWMIPKLIKIDMYTSVAWILIAATAVNILLFLPGIFKEHNMLAKEELTMEKETYRSESYKCVAWLFVLMNFIVTFNFMFTKVLGTPLAMDEFAMTREEVLRLNSLVMIGGTIISFLSILLIHPLCKVMSEMKVLVFGLALMIIGRCCFYPWSSELPLTFDDAIINKTDIDFRTNETLGCPLSQSWCTTDNKLLFAQYILGNVIENIGYPISITLTLAIFSKVLGSKKQGTWMGVLTGIGSTARITSPIFISSLYENFGPSVVTVVTNVFFTIVVITLIRTAMHYFVSDKKKLSGEVVRNDDLEQNPASLDQPNSPLKLDVS